MTWREVASGKLNTAVAGALSLTAAKLVEDLHDHLCANYDRCGNFQEIIDLINTRTVSSDNRDFTCMAAHECRKRSADACRQRWLFLLENLPGPDNMSPQYRLPAAVGEFGCPRDGRQLGPTKLVHDIIALVQGVEPGDFTKRLRPDTGFQFQIILDSIYAAEESQILDTPPHLPDLRRF